jgi:membrane-associated phospholipid phosphatase
MRKVESVFARPDQEMIRLFGKWLAIVLSVFLLAYLSANQLATENPQRYEMYADWELDIPLIPEMIVVYLSYVAVFLLLPWVMKSGQALVSLAYAFLFGILVSTIVFVLFPGELGYHRPDHVSEFNFLFQTLYQIDQPHNLYPSLHVTFSSLTAAAMVHQTKSLLFHRMVAAWAVMIAASVVLVHQHHLFDILTGLILAGASYRFVYLRFV